MAPIDKKTETDFWGNAAPGLFSFGSDIYSSSQARKGTEALLRAQRPEVSDAFGNASMQQLKLAGAADPQAFAADRFSQQQALLQPIKEKQEQDLVRMLRAKGMLGAANYAGAGVDPISRTGQTWAQAPGVATNPHMAAFMAARAGQESKDAYASLAEGDKHVNSILSRAGLLNTHAQHAKPAAAIQTSAAKAKFGQLPGVLKGIGTLVKENPAIGTGVVNFGKDLAKKSGLFGDGGSWVTAGSSMFDPYDYSKFDLFQPDFGAGYY